ncbi:MAG: pyridoxine 5'-phosphate synthase [Campylobacteraceae bacterium]|jgi:pyridoxine 5-phosphate synthase|nr:pyridoxine 5'-phosphate synthase [Campylobacteraceae bacterium]
MLLGVNIDHIAFLREARRTNDPNPLEALCILKKCAVSQVTIHLREDRRHIHDEDLFEIVKTAYMPVNLECSLNDEMIDIALKAKPTRVTLVPEKREEVTTEGGLDVKRYFDKLTLVCKKFKEAGIDVSLFIDPNLEIVNLSNDLGVKWIELHTGKYADIYAMLNTNLRQTHNSVKSLELSSEKLNVLLEKSLKELIRAAHEAHKLGLLVAAGHGLNYYNVKNIAEIEEIKELNIGQSIIARSLFWGLEEAITKMQEQLKTSR